MSIKRDTTKPAPNVEETEALKEDLKADLNTIDPENIEVIARILAENESTEPSGQNGEKGNKCQ